MKCKCGNEAKVYVKGENMCWGCHDPKRAVEEVLHIDKNVWFGFPRTRLCDGGPGDGIHHMTPTIAASYMAQHPDQQGEFCRGCLAVMYRDYLPTIAEARLYAASLKS